MGCLELDQEYSVLDDFPPSHQTAR